MTGLVSFLVSLSAGAVLEIIVLLKQGKDREEAEQVALDLRVGPLEARFSRSEGAGVAGVFAKAHGTGAENVSRRHYYARMYLRQPGGGTSTTGAAPEAKPRWTS